MRDFDLQMKREAVKVSDHAHHIGTNKIYMSMEAAKYHHLFHGQYIQIGNDSDEFKRISQIELCEFTSQDSIYGYISSLTALHLNHQPYILGDEFELSIRGYISRPHIQSCSNLSLASMTTSLSMELQKTNYMGMIQDIIKEQLAGEDAVFMKGDIFEMKIPKNILLHSLDLDISLIKDNDFGGYYYLYFKLDKPLDSDGNQIFGGGVFNNQSTNSILLDSPKPSYLPSRKTEHFNLLKEVDPLFVFLLDTILAEIKSSRILLTTILVESTNSISTRYLDLIKTTLSSYVGIQPSKLNMVSLIESSLEKTVQNLFESFKQDLKLGPVLYFLNRVELLNEFNLDWKSLLGLLTTASLNRLWMFPIFFVVFEENKVQGLKGARQSFEYVFKFKSYSKNSRCKILEFLMHAISFNFDLEAIAEQTKGFDYESLSNLINDAIYEFFKRTKDEKAKVILEMQDVQASLDKLSKKKNRYIHTLTKTPNTNWEDIGGLESTKQQLMKTIQNPLLHPDMYGSVIKCSGICLYGPPGTGKTLLAKAIATEFKLSFLSVKGPELLNMYVGESEANIRNLFKAAKETRPSLIFFDELDALAPARGSDIGSGGAVDRVVSQLLAELDGLDDTIESDEDQDREKNSGKVFVMGATNRLDLLDPALLRPGRLDTLIPFGLAETNDALISILKALTRKFHFQSGFCWETLLEKIQVPISGADLYAICSSACLNSIQRKISEMETETETEKMSFSDDKEDIIQSNKKDILITEVDFLIALESI